MKKVIILASMLMLASCNNGVYVYKPITAKHFKEKRDNGKDYNEFYKDSVGLGYRNKKGFGGSITYVDKNSLGNNSTYAHLEYIPTIWNNRNYNLNVGGALGVRNGYPKKSKGISNDDFIPSGNLQAELCKGKFCSVLQLVPTESGVVIFGFKYNF